MAEIATILTAEEFIIIRRALEAYHAYLVALNKNGSSLDALQRVERIFAKIGELKVIDSEE